MKSLLLRFIKDIRFWILFFFLLRLYCITNPPLEIAHNWRQTTGYMVARNFYEIDSNIFYPRLDMAGDKTGITGTEFSVLNYLIYLLSLVFGFHDWFGRLINLIVSSIGIFYFYKLIKLKFGERLAFLSAYLLLISDWFIYSRKGMPDTFSTALVIMSLYFAFRYFENYKWKNIFFYFLFAMLGVLSKIPAAYLLVLLWFPLNNKEIPIRYRLYVIAATGLMFVPVIWWYFYWVPYLTQHFGFSHYYMGVSVQLGLRQLMADLPAAFEKFYYDALKFMGFAAFLGGVYMAWKRRDKGMQKIFLLTAGAFFVFMAKAGGNFCVHSYYVIPFVPVMCFFAAFLLNTFKKEWVLVLAIVALTVENIANQQHDFRIKESEKYKLTLEPLADRISKRNDLIAINCDPNPQQIYLTHRKGWNITTKEAQDVQFMDSLRLRQCKFLFINKHELKGDEVFPFEQVVYNGDDFVIYGLSR